MTIPKPDGLPDFCLSLGKVMGAAYPGRDSAVVMYLKAYGVTDVEIEVFYNAGVKIAEAFYRDPVAARKPPHGPSQYGVTKATWHRLPIKLRQRWWDETDFNEKAPSPELVGAMKAAMAEIQ